MPPLGVEPTPWEVLGVPEGSSPAVVRTAWRRAVRESHPDHVGGGDVERFLRVNDAYRQIEETFAPLRGAHPVDVDVVGYVGEPASPTDDPDPFDFLDGDPGLTEQGAGATDDSPSDSAGRAAPGDEIEAVVAAPGDPYEVFDAAIDAALGTGQPRRWSRSASRRRISPSTAAAGAAPPPATAEGPTPTGRGGTPVAVAAASAAKAMVAAGGAVRPAVVAGAASAAGFVALRLFVQAAAAAVQAPVAAVAGAAALVGATCWFAVSRLGDEPDPRIAAVTCGALVVIVAAVDILLLGAVPLLLIGTVAYTATHRGHRDRARR